MNQVSEVQLTYKSKVKPIELVTGSISAVNVFKSIENYNRNMEMYECFYAMYLNRANKVLSVMMISEGGTSGTVTDVKKIIAPAILQNASGIIISHNHPSGNTYPSSQDKTITEKIKNACKLLDINLFDHIILTESDGFYSFSDSGDL
jgi:DNA repair protein RadC